MRTAFFLAVLLTSVLANAAGSPSQPLTLPAWVGNVAIGNVGDGHPDLRALRAGLRHLDEGRYAAAMRSFNAASRLADKASQAMIAFMFSAGIGVERDSVKALAWMALAAERGYPVLVTERNQLAESLDSDQQARAGEITRTLQGEHGDAVAKQRLDNEMSMRLLPPMERRVTGSRVGNTAGIRGGAPNAEGRMSFEVGGGTPRGGAGVSRRWNADRYWAAQDRLWSNLRDNG